VFPPVTRNLFGFFRGLPPYLFLAFEGLFEAVGEVEVCDERSDVLHVFWWVCVNCGEFQGWVIFMV